MRMTRLAAVLGAVTLALTAAACGGNGDDAGSGSGSGASGIVGKATNDKKLVVGVKADQPGLGLQTAGTYTGFDIEIAKIIAGQLGIAPDKIELVERVSKNREPFIQNGTVDFIVATYSITDKRKKIISFAGPYYVTGQQLLVLKENDDIKGPNDLAGKKVCSVAGSTPLGKIQAEYKQAKPIAFATYTECVDQLLNKQVDAVTTDGAILLGYAARQPDKLKVVGEPFSEEKYGIGLKKDDKAFRDFINDSLEKAFDNGDWEEAFETTLGKSGVETPDKPQLERY